MMMPPRGQSCSGADSGETADITAALTPRSPTTCTASREQPARTKPAERAKKRPRRFAFMMLPSLCCSARRHVLQSRTGCSPRRAIYKPAACEARARDTVRGCVRDKHHNGKQRKGYDYVIE